MTPVVSAGWTFAGTCWEYQLAWAVACMLSNFLQQLRMLCFFKVVIFRGTVDRHIDRAAVLHLFETFVSRSCTLDAFIYVLDCAC